MLLSPKLSLFNVHSGCFAQNPQPYTRKIIAITDIKWWFLNMLLSDTNDYLQAHWCLLHALPCHQRSHVMFVFVRPASIATVEHSAMVYTSAWNTDVSLARGTVTDAEMHCGCQPNIKNMIPWYPTRRTLLSSQYSFQTTLTYLYSQNQTLPSRSPSLNLARGICQPQCLILNRNPFSLLLRILLK